MPIVKCHVVWRDIAPVQLSSARQLMLCACTDDHPAPSDSSWMELLHLEAKWKMEQSEEETACSTCQLRIQSLKMHPVMAVAEWDLQMALVRCLDVRILSEC